MKVHFVHNKCVTNNLLFYKIFLSNSEQPICGTTAASLRALMQTQVEDDIEGAGKDDLNGLECRAAPESQVAQWNRWQAVFLEAGGLNAALSEQSMWKLKYCLHWLQVRSFLHPLSRSYQCPTDSCRIPVHSGGMEIGRGLCQYCHSCCFSFQRNPYIPELILECSPEFTGTECNRNTFSGIVFNL